MFPQWTWAFSAGLYPIYTCCIWNLWTLSTMYIAIDVILYHSTSTDSRTTRRSKAKKREHCGDTLNTPVLPWGQPFFEGIRFALLFAEVAQFHGVAEFQFTRGHLNALHILKHESRVRSFPENSGRMRGYYWWAGVFSSMAVGWGYIRIVEQKRRWQGPTIFHWLVEEQALLGIITPARNEEIKNLSSGFPISELKRNLPSKLPSLSLEILNPRVYHINHHLQKSLLLHCLRQGSFQPFIERFHTAHGTIFFGVGLKHGLSNNWSPQTRVNARRKGQLNEEDTFGHNILQEHKSMVSETKKTSKQIKDRSDIGTKLGYF